MAAYKDKHGYAGKSGGALKQLSSASEAVGQEDAALKQPSSASEAAGPLLFVVAGGVAANKTVRCVLENMASKHGFAFLAPPMAYCTDNAAMIALAGAERLALGLTSDIDAAARPRWPLDEDRALADPVHKPGRKGAKA